MFSYWSEFVLRHKKKFITVGICIGGAILSTKYVQQRFIEWQENETREFYERARKQHYFENSEKTCNQTIYFLSSTLKENIIDQVNCEEVIQKLKEGSSNKIELWQDLKVLVFTKVCLLVYSGTLLVIALRIQVNVIGGHIYRKTLVSKNKSEVTSDLQEKYLSQCHYFLKEGIKQIYPFIREKVHFVLKDVTLKQNLSLKHIENIFWAIQSSVNSDSRNPLKNMPQLLYGSGFDEKSPFIKDMMLDTIDLLQSHEVTDLASSCVSVGFSNVMDKISEYFLPDGNNSTSFEFSSTSKEMDTFMKFSHPNKLSKPFAKIIPMMNTFGNQVNEDKHETWISPFIYMEKIKMLGANIYESYSCVEN